jgi:hypothetical protein
VSGLEAPLEFLDLDNGRALISVIESSRIKKSYVFKLQVG